MLIQNSLNWWRQLTFSSKYISKVVTAFRNLVVYFWHNIIMFLAHSECTRFSYIQVSVHYQTRGPILQKLSAGSIQLRVKKKRNLYLSFTVVVRELWLLYIYALWMLKGLRQNPPPHRYYEFNNKGQCCKNLFQWKHECIRCFLKNHSDIRWKLGSDFDSTCRPNSI